MKLGVLVSVIGALLLGLAIFGMGIIPSWPGLFAGLILLAGGVARLLLAGWHGRDPSWLVAAPAAAILVWTVYEIVRQEVPMPGIGILGEMTAPSLSGAVVVGILVVGLLRRGHAPRETPTHAD